MIKVAANLIFIAASFALSPAFGAPSTQPTRLEVSDLYNLHSATLSNALMHPDKLVDFITDPQTAYPDRMGAAVQGAKLVPIRQMPTVLSERDDLIRNPGGQLRWGLDPDPMQQLAQPRYPEREKAEEIVVLGHPWELPAKNRPYPQTWQEECNAPWPWQVQQALYLLFGSMIPSIYTDGPDACKNWLDVAMTMPFRTDEDATRFVDATESIHFSTLAVMSRWRRIAGNPGMHKAAAMISLRTGDQGCLWNDQRAQGLIQLVTLPLLERRDLPEDRPILALDRMRPKLLGYPGAWERGLPLPATVVVKVSELALDPKFGSAEKRLYFALEVCSVADHPPSQLADKINDGLGDPDRKLKIFEAWYSQEKLQLHQKAAIEAPYLKKLREESDQAAAQFEANDTGKAPQHR